MVKQARRSLGWQLMKARERFVWAAESAEEVHAGFEEAELRQKTIQKHEWTVTHSWFVCFIFMFDEVVLKCPVWCETKAQSVSGRTNVSRSLSCVSLTLTQRLVWSQTDLSSVQSQRPHSSKSVPEAAPIPDRTASLPRTDQKKTSWSLLQQLTWSQKSRDRFCPSFKCLFQEAR